MIINGIYETQNLLLLQLVSFLVGLRTYQHPRISFDASLVIYINSINIPPIMIINRIYETQNLLSLQLVYLLVGLRTYQHSCTTFQQQQNSRTHLKILVARKIRRSQIHTGGPKNISCQITQFSSPCAPGTRYLCTPILIKQVQESSYSLYNRRSDILNFEALTVGRRTLTAKSRFLSQAIPSWICGAQSGTGTFRIPHFPPCQ